MSSIPIAVIAIVMIFVVFPSIVFSGIAKIKRAQRAELPENSVGMAELEERIQRAVQTANEPLKEEIRALEGRLDAVLEERRLSGRDEPARLGPYASQEAKV